MARPTRRVILVWSAASIVIAAALYFAATSPLLQWRQPVYIVAGFAGVCAMALLLIQPLLASGHFAGQSGRRAHRWTGGALLALVVIHVGGLWITSPPDVIDVFLLRSPTPFSIWGLFALAALCGAAALAVARPRLRWRPIMWRRTHAVLVVAIVVGTLLHAFLIEGTMESVSKFVLGGAVLFAVLGAFLKLRTFSPRRKTS